MFSLLSPLPTTQIHHILTCRIPKTKSNSKPSFIQTTTHNNRIQLRNNFVATASIDVKSPEEVEGALPEGLRPDLIPKHVAIIMDGHGRWAQERGLPTSAGHEAGVRPLKEMVELCSRWGIPVLTVFAFSTENWRRSKDETQYFMSLVERELKSSLKCFSRKGIRVSVIGVSSKLPNSLQNLINHVEETTRNNSKLHLIIALSYGGKSDILQACRSIAKKTKDGDIQVENIDEGVMEQELETRCTEFPHPDLMIRPSGEVRLSNFLLWQLAYTEFVFVKPCWPDFGRGEFVEALMAFQKRQRRFGGRP